MAGYSGTPLPKKLGIGPNARVGLFGAPEAFASSLGELPVGARVACHTLVSLKRKPSTSELLDTALLFVRTRAELEATFAVLTARMTPAGGLWVAWPKKASKVPTDMTEHAAREIGLPTGFVDNKVCAIDEVWSGLRFVLRKQLRT